MLLLHHHLVLLRVVLNPLLISPFRPLRNPRGLLKRETARSHLSVRRHSTVHLHLARFLAPFFVTSWLPHALRSLGLSALRHALRAHRLQRPAAGDARHLLKRLLVLRLLLHHRSALHLLPAHGLLLQHLHVAQVLLPLLLMTGKEVSNLLLSTHLLSHHPSLLRAVPTNTSAIFVASHLHLHLTCICVHARL